MPFLQECVRGALRGKTILLVTHQVDFLHNVDLITVSVFSPLAISSVTFLTVMNKHILVFFIFIF